MVKKKKVKEAEEQIPKFIEERESVKDLGETIQKTAINSAPEMVIEKISPKICSCGATLKSVSKIYLCPSCGHTWCAFCFRMQTICGKCGTQGV